MGQVHSVTVFFYRHRYQTEGSRGAVKDRSGNGFPVVKLIAYDKPATLQIFIGTDVGRVAPHMFYQACKVSGKNSTPCNEKKVEGTIVIEIDLKPESEMTATCDCVGILKVSRGSASFTFRITQSNLLPTGTKRRRGTPISRADDWTTKQKEVHPLSYGVPYANHTWRWHHRNATSVFSANYMQ